MLRTRFQKPARQTIGNMDDKKENQEIGHKEVKGARGFLAAKDGHEPGKTETMAGDMAKPVHSNSGNRMKTTPR